MPDERTAKIQTNETTIASTQEVVREVTQRITELAGLLRSQQDILRKRGMNLPSGALDTLRTIQMRLEAMNKQLVNMGIELRQLRALAQTTALINSSLDTNEVLNQVMDTVIQLTGAERGYILLKNKNSGEMEFIIGRGIDRETLNKGDFVVSRTVVSEVVNRGEAVLTDNASQDSRYQGQQSIIGLQMRSILCVPLKVRGEVIGVVYCDNRIIAGIFKEHELGLANAFGGQAAVAIENARLFESVRAQLAEITRTRDLMEHTFASIVSGVIAVALDGTVTTCTPPAQRILGPQAADWHNKQLAQLMPDMDEDFYLLLERVDTSGQEEEFETSPVIEGMGQRSWKLIVSPLRDAARGVTQGIVIVLDDLTESKQREEQLQKVRTYLPTAQLDDSISIDYISNISVEEREITVLSADVRGFTAFSERLDPQELMQIINKYLDVASEAIGLQNGMVDKFLGDAVTGLFNTQLNQQGDHAVRAVRAGMSLVFDLYALHEVLPEDQRLFYGVGIHTGPAVLGNIGGPSRKEFSALGEAMQISKLLQENALGGEIIISESTYHIVQDFFECEAMEPRKTKGYDLRVMYKVIKRKKGRGTSQLDPEFADLLKD
ncbi:MAG: GAF domain-containing protein [Chloroflexi bacterium]|nr:GAF domain-containing protein [Chloroflexota bacterium]